MSGVRVLLIYQFFGPYHEARWLHFRRLALLSGIEPLALQIFRQPDLNDWTARGSIPGVTSLNLMTDGNDNLRWLDALRLFGAFEKLEPDVVLVNGWGSRDAVLAHAWCRWRGTARVLVSDSQSSDFNRNRLKEGLKRKIIHGVRSAFVAGAPQRRYVEALGVRPAAVVDGCDVVDNAHFAPARVVRQTGGFRLLTVARWSPEKNLLEAGKAFMAFVAGRPESEPWCWSLVGYGPLAEQVKSMAQNSQGRIRLLGAKTYTELPAAFADADLYWQPSIRETWGLVVNEAMAAGLPVLVSNRCGCHEDLVTPGTGWRFDPFSEQGMVQALEGAACHHAAWPMMGAAAVALIDRWGLPRFSAGVLDAVRIATALDSGNQ